MSHTVRCSICHDITDADAHPELNVAPWVVCEDCWHNMQDYLTARGFTLMQFATPERQIRIKEEL